MKKISFLFLFISSCIFSCVNPSRNFTEKQDSVSDKALPADSVSQNSIPSRIKVKDRDTLIPEKMTAEKIIGAYNFYYGNWGFDLEVTNKKIGERMSMPDTLNEGWIGTWKIKDDTLIAEGYTCFGGGENPYATGWPKSDSAEYYCSLEYEMKRMDNVIAYGWKSADKEDKVETKFILVRGNLIELDYLDSGELFPEELTRIR